MVILRAHSFRAKIVKNVNIIMNVLKKLRFLAKLCKLYSKKEAPKGFEKFIVLNIDHVLGA